MSSEEVLSSDGSTPLSKAQIIIQALPFMQRYDKQVVLIKYGGHAMGNEALSHAFAQDVTLLRQSGVHPVVVHGGGPQIGTMLERLNIQTEFRAGLRVTDRATIEVVEMVLAGKINKDIAQKINAEGGRAVGLCGKDGAMVVAQKLEHRSYPSDSELEKIVDLGFVGRPVEVNPTVLELMMKEDLIPVVAPIASGHDGHTYNINADSFAGALAASLRAKRLLFLTDVPGVLDEEGQLIRELTITQALALIDKGVISGGMIPKVETCIAAVEQGVEGVVILNGKVLHSVLLELFTGHGVGTLIRA